MHIKCPSLEMIMLTYNVTYNYWLLSIIDLGIKFPNYFFASLFFSLSLFNSRSTNND